MQYNDGFGRVLQSRSQAEDTLFGDATFGGGVIPGGDLAPVGDTAGRTRAASDPDNVVVSGWQLYDNKGQVVQKYEPFFSSGYGYDPPGDAQLGQRTTMFYDARQQLVRTVSADGSEQRVVRGIPVDLTDPDDSDGQPRCRPPGQRAGRARQRGRGRDAKGAVQLVAFDLLHRPSQVWARNQQGGAVTLRQIVEYGDAGIPDQPPADRAAARTGNLLGRWSRHHDEAGLVTVASVDVQGNVRETTRLVIADAPLLATYDLAAAAGWQVAPFQVDWTASAGQTRADRDGQLLEATNYVTSTRYDALNRITRRLLPADVEGVRREVLVTHSRGGAVESLTLDGTVHVQRIAHDAKGQRALIAYGNGVMTRYAYDPHTFRLVRMRSEHYTPTGAAGYHPTGDPVQDVGYDYDLAGNTVSVRDRTPGSGIPNNPGALAVDDPVLRKLIGNGDALDRHFGYDPTYRLLSATGREAQTPPGGDPWIDRPRGTDPTTAQPYTESYRIRRRRQPAEPRAHRHRRVHPGLHGGDRQQPGGPDDGRDDAVRLRLRPERQPRHRSRHPALRLEPGRPADRVRHPDPERGAVRARPVPIRQSGRADEEAGPAPGRGRPPRRDQFRQLHPQALPLYRQGRRRGERAELSRRPLPESGAGALDVL